MKNAPFYNNSLLISHTSHMALPSLCSIFGLVLNQNTCWDKNVDLVESNYSLVHLHLSPGLSIFVATTKEI